MDEARFVAMETPLISEDRAAGAELAEFDGCVLPARFSKFEEEYRAGRESVALFDTNWHVILTLSGRDRVSYLHNISSNDIKGLADGRGMLALLLNPQGHILAELEVYAMPEKLLVLSHAVQRERTVATLKKYVIGSQVKVEDLTDQTGSLAVEGPRTAEAIEKASGVSISALPEMATQDVTIEGAVCHLLRRSHFGQGGAELIAPRKALPELWRKLLSEVQALGGAPIGMAALNSLRLDARVPWFPADFNDAMIPHEAAVENTHISFNKGCYTGQEIVERVRSRGQVNRKRVMLKFATATPPPAGTKLRAGDAEVGFITSSALSPAAGSAIGMGYVRREQFAQGCIVEYEGGTAEVQ